MAFSVDYTVYNFQVHLANSLRTRCVGADRAGLCARILPVAATHETCLHAQIAYKERRWFLQKRYSQFDNLDNVLNERYPDVMMSVQKLPPKKPFGSLDASLIAMRQKSLDAYLQALLARPVLARSEHVIDFLEMPLDIRKLDSDEQRHLMAAQDAVRH